MDARFEHLLKEHEKEFGKKDNVALFSTAGRTELAGNHTDHNLGLVITGTINLDTIYDLIKADLVEKGVEE